MTIRPARRAFPAFPPRRNAVDGPVNTYSEDGVDATHTRIGRDLRTCKAIEQASDIRPIYIVIVCKKAGWTPAPPNNFLKYFVFSLLFGNQSDILILGGRENG